MKHQLLPGLPQTGRNPASSILVKSESPDFGSPVYQISNQSGKVIRKGHVSSSTNECYVSTAGLDQGEYLFEMGEIKEKIVVSK